MENSGSLTLLQFLDLFYSYWVALSSLNIRFPFLTLPCFSCLSSFGGLIFSKEEMEGVDLGEREVAGN